MCWWCVSVRALVIVALFGPGPGLQAVAWPVVFSCGLGVHLCTLLLSVLMAFLVYHVLYRCRAFLSLPSLPVVLVCYCLGLVLGSGLCLGLGLGIG